MSLFRPWALALAAFLVTISVIAPVAGPCHVAHAHGSAAVATDALQDGSVGSGAAQTAPGEIRDEHLPLAADIHHCGCTACHPAGMPGEVLTSPVRLASRSAPPIPHDLGPAGTDPEKLPEPPRSPA